MSPIEKELKAMDNEEGSTVINNCVLILAESWLYLWAREGNNGKEIIEAAMRKLCNVTD